MRNNLDLPILCWDNVEPLSVTRTHYWFNMSYLLLEVSSPHVQLIINIPYY